MSIYANDTNAGYAYPLYLQTLKFDSPKKYDNKQIEEILKLSTFNNNKIIYS